jgi:hypothetical protein
LIMFFKFLGNLLQIGVVDGPWKRAIEVGRTRRSVMRS